MPLNKEANTESDSTSLPSEHLQNRPVSMPYSKTHFLKNLFFFFFFFVLDVNLLRYPIAFIK